MQFLVHLRMMTQGVEGLGLASGAASKLGAALGGVGKMAAGAGAALGAIGVAAFAREALQAAVSYESAFTKVYALTEISRAEINRLRDDVQRLAGALGQSPQKLADGLFAVTSAGARGADAMNILRVATQASAIGMGEVSDVARALNAVLMAYGSETISAARAGDVLLQVVREGSLEADQLAPALGRVVGIAATLGVSLEELGAFIATYSRLGLSASEVMTGLRGSMMQMLGPAEQQKEALLELHASGKIAFETFDELRKAIRERGLTSVLNDLVVAADGNVDVLARLVPDVRALAGVMGTAGVQSDTLTATLGRLKHQSASVADTFEEVRNSDPTVMWSQLKAQGEQVTLTLGRELMPTLTAVADVLKYTLVPAIDVAVAALNNSLFGAVARLVDHMRQTRTEANVEMARMVADSRATEAIFVALGKARRSGGELASSDLEAPLAALDSMRARLAGIRELQAELSRQAVASDGWTEAAQEQFSALSAEAGQLATTIDKAAAAIARIKVKAPAAQGGAGSGKAPEPTDEQKRYAAALEDARAAVARLLDEETRRTTALAKGEAALAAVNKQIERERELLQATKGLAAKDAAEIEAAFRKVWQQQDLQMAAEFFKTFGSTMAGAFAGSFNAGLAQNPIVLKDEAAIQAWVALQFEAGQIEAAWDDVLTVTARKVERVRELEQQGALSTETAVLEIQALWIDALQAMGQQAQNLLSSIANLGSLGQSNFMRSAQTAMSGYQTWSTFMGSASQAAGFAASKGWMSAGTASAAASIAGTFAIFYLVYDYVDKWIKKKKSKQFGNETALTIVDGDYGVTALSRNSTALIGSIKSAIDSLEDVLRTSVTDLAAVSIRIRNNGKGVRAEVAGAFVGIFSSVEDAINAALGRALQTAEFANVDPLIKKALQALQGTDLGLDQLAAQLASVQAIADLGKSGAVIEFQKAMLYFDRLAEVVKELNLGLEAALKVETARANWMVDWYNRLMGIAQDPKSQWQNEVKAYNEERALRYAALIAQKAEITAMIARVRVTRFMTQDQLDQLAELGRGHLAFNSAMGQSVEELEEALKLIQHAIDNLPPEIPAGTEPPKAKGGGGGRQDARRDLQRQARYFGVGDVGRSILDVQLQLQDFIAQVKAAGFSASDAAKLIAAATKDAQRQLALIKRTIIGDAKSFILGPKGALAGEVKAVGTQAADLIAGLRALRDAGKMTGAEFRRLRDDIKAAAAAEKDRIVQSASNDLYGQLLDLTGREKESAEFRWKLQVEELRMRREMLALAMLEAGYAKERMAAILGPIDALLEEYVKKGPPSGTTDPGVQRPRGNRADADAAAADALAKAVDSANKLLAGYESSAAGAFATARQKIVTDFEEISRVLGWSIRVQTAYANAIDKLYRETLAPLLDRDRDLLTGGSSALKVGARFALEDARVRELAAAVRAGDLDRVQELADAIDAATALASELYPSGSSPYRHAIEGYRALIAEIVQRFGVGASQPLPGVGAIPAPGGVAGAGGPTGPNATLAASAAEQLAELRAIRLATQQTAAAAQATHHALTSGAARFQLVN